MNQPMDTAGQPGLRGPEAAGAGPAERRLLVASANSLTRDLAAVIFKRHGFKVATAKGLDQAVGMARAESFAAVFADSWPEFADAGRLRELASAAGSEARLVLLVEPGASPELARAAGAEATLSCHFEEAAVREILEQLRARAPCRAVRGAEGD